MSGTGELIRLTQPLCSPGHFFTRITATRPRSPAAAEAELGEGQQRREQKRSSQPPPRHWEGFAILYFMSFLSASLPLLHLAPNCHKTPKKDVYFEYLNPDRRAQR